MPLHRSTVLVGVSYTCQWVCHTRVSGCVTHVSVGVSHTAITMSVGVSYTAITVPGFKLLKVGSYAGCFVDKEKKNLGRLAGYKVSTMDECQSKCLSNSECKFFSFFHPGCELYTPKLQPLWDLKIKTKEACEAKCKSTSGCHRAKFYPSGYCQMNGVCNYFGHTGRYTRWISSYGRGGGTNQTFGC